MAGEVELEKLEAIRLEHSKLVTLEDPMEVTRRAARLYYSSEKEMGPIKLAWKLESNSSLQTHRSVDSGYCKL